MAKKCSANNRDGKKGGAWVITGETKCPLHLDPKRAAKLGAKHGCKTVLIGDDDLAPMDPPKTARDVFARELGVDAIVEGAVLRSNDRVRITAQLIDARSPSSSSSMTYNAW